MGTPQSPHSSLGRGKSPGRVGAPRGPRQPWERFPGRRCYFGRVKQEGEGCRGKFNVPPAGPAPIQAGMKTTWGKRAAEAPVEGPAPTGTGGTRGTRTGTRRSPRGQDGVSSSELRRCHPPALFLRIIWLRDGVWDWIIPALARGRAGQARGSAAALVPQFPQGFGAQAPGLDSPRSPGKAQPWISGAGSGGRFSCRPHTAARPLHRLLPSAGGFPGC